jgi:hypothetical protein
MTPPNNPIPIEPCPFCGGEMIWATQYFAHPAGTDCPLEDHGWAAEQAAAWNTRTIINALRVDEAAMQNAISEAFNELPHGFPLTQTEAGKVTRAAISTLCVGVK